MTVEVTVEALEELGLAVGTAIWVAMKATDLGVQPGDGGGRQAG